MELQIHDLLVDTLDTPTIQDMLLVLDALTHYSEWVLEQEREAGDPRPWQQRQAAILTASRRMATVVLLAEHDVLLETLVFGSDTSG